MTPGGSYSNSTFEVRFRLAESLDTLKRLRVISNNDYQLSVRWGGDVYDHRYRPLDCFARSLETPPDLSEFEETDYITNGINSKETIQSMLPAINDTPFPLEFASLTSTRPTINLDMIRVSL